MTENNSLKPQSELEIKFSKYRSIKKIFFVVITGTGVIISIYIFYKNYDKFINYYNDICEFYDKLCYYSKIIKNLFFFKIGLNLTKRSIKIVTE